MTLSPLATLVLRLFAGVSLMLVVASVTVVGRSRLGELRGQATTRLREAVPWFGVLVAILLVNKVARDAGPELSWVVGWNVTGAIYALEGDVVAVIQSIATPAFTALFGFVYLFGYVFLLVFPFLAYLALSDRRPLKLTIVAYTVNYALGMVCYILFISYGPRNMIPNQVESLLYATYPQTQILTGEVNVNTNVFPSLHTSLSVTVATLAVRTRDRYPVWAALAVTLAAAIAFATMYLGIHWATDVVAGILLGVFSVGFAERVVD